MSKGQTHEEERTEQVKISDVTVLSEEEIKSIDTVSRKVLTEMGILVLSEKVLKQLADRGVDVDFQKKIVKLNDKVIDDCLASAPKSIRITPRPLPLPTATPASSLMKIPGCISIKVAIMTRN